MGIFRRGGVTVISDPTPPVRPVVVWVNGRGDGDVVAGARVRFGGFEGVTAPDGHFGANLPASATHINVAVETEAYQPYGVEVDIPPDRALDLIVGGVAREGQIALPSLRPVLPDFLPTLRTRGHFFERETGERITLIEASDFNLYNRFLSGEDIEPILTDREGFNLGRVWLSYPDIPLIGQLNPMEHPDFYARFPEFVRQAGAHGRYIEFTAFAGPGWMTHAQQRERWQRTIDGLQGLPVLLEMANENNHPGNAGLVADLPRPVGVLASHGSNMSQDAPPRPAWDYEVYHTNASGPEEMRKIGHNAMEDCADVTGVPAITNETSRFPDVGMWAGASPERVRQMAFDSAAGAALLCAGSCFHSSCGKNSTLFDAAHRLAAQAWIRGANSVPLHCPSGGYEHLANLEGPNEIRVYRRGGDDACLVRIRR